MSVVEKKKGKGRNRFLYDVEWMVVRAKMNWDRWGYIDENLVRVKHYFNEDPSWVRAYRAWRLVHQMAGYTGHPSLIKAREEWRVRMVELDEGKISEIEAAVKMKTCLDAGLSAGEIKRLKKLCRNGPDWKWNPSKLLIAKQCDGRLGKKASSI